MWIVECVEVNENLCEVQVTPCGRSGSFVRATMRGIYEGEREGAFEMVNPSVRSALY